MNKTENKKANLLFWIVLIIGFAAGVVGACFEITAVSVVGILIMVASPLLRKKTDKQA